MSFGGSEVGEVSVDRIYSSSAMSMDGMCVRFCRRVVDGCPRVVGGMCEGRDAHQHHIVLAEVVTPLLPSDGKLFGHHGGRPLLSAVGSGSAGVKAHGEIKCYRRR